MHEQDDSCKLTGINSSILSLLGVRSQVAVYWTAWAKLTRGGPASAFPLAVSGLEHLPEPVPSGGGAARIV